MTTIGTRSDAGKVLLGCPRRGPEKVATYPHNNSVVGPGVAGCLNSSGKFVAGAAAPLIGISRGKSLNHAAMNSVTLKGKEVPIKLADLGVQASLVVGDLTFTAVEKGVAGNDITITLVDGLSGGAASVTVDGTDIVIGIEDETTTAQTIATAIAESEEASALVTVEIAEGEEDTGQDAAAEDALENGYNSYDYVVPGAAVFVNDTTGLATEEDTGTTNSGWTYDSEVLTGVDPDGGEDVGAALVNM